MSLFLTSDELAELTGYRRQSLQKKALSQLRLPFRSRPADGFPLVDRSHFATAMPTRGKRGPDFDAVAKAV